MNARLRTTLTHARRALERRSAPVTLIALGIWLVSCAGADVSSRQPRTPPLPTVLVHTVPADQGVLAFPPPLTDGRRPRPAIPADYARFDAGSELKVVEPEPGADGKFDIRGTSLRIRFNQPVAGAAANVPAGAALALTPSVPGLARWLDETTLEFKADRPFDPDARYDLSVGAVQSRSGKPLAQPFRASFHATPLVLIAGKELEYLPKTGEPRVITVRPSDSKIGRNARFAALYDQPIDLELARKLLELSSSGSSGNGVHGAAAGLTGPVPLALRHPPKDEFEGVKVDRRLVVLAQPARLLAHGESLSFVANDLVRASDRKPMHTDVEVAEPLAQQEISCGYGQPDGESCDFDQGTLRTSGRTVHVRFNNHISTSSKRLPGHVQVTPAVRNLSIQEEGWEDGRLVLTGDFRPSTNYSVTISGLTDWFGGPQAAAVRFRVQTLPLGASVTIPEGLVLLDPEAGRRFPVHSRNVAEAMLELWPVASGDVEAFRTALRSSRGGELAPSGTPVRIPVKISAERDQPAETMVDLTRELTPGTSYLATVSATRYGFGAEPMQFPRGSEATRPPVALLRMGSPDALAVHVHGAPDAMLVHVAHLRSGDPVGAAGVSLVGPTSAPPVMTDAFGVAVLPLAASVGTLGNEDALLSVESGAERLLVPVGRPDATAETLFPDLGSGERHGDVERRAVVVTDRGIYRPGAGIDIQATVYKVHDGALSPAKGNLLRLRLVGPTGDTVYSQAVVTGEMGSVAARCDLPADAKLGQHQLLLEDPLHPTQPIGQGVVRVAEFEAPRFAVDVLLAQPGPDDMLHATVRGRYLFGSPMDNSPVQYTLRRTPAELPSGPLSAAGLVFGAEPSWWYDEDGPREPAWTRTGEGRLDREGMLKVDQQLGLKGVTGPQRFELEAEVSDNSYRHIAGRGSVVRHPAARYAGLKGPRGWVDVGQDVAVELGVSDTSGAPVSDVPVTARLERLEWRYVSRRVAGGALRNEWTAVRTEAGRCSVQSDVRPKVCTLRVSQSGDYQVTAEVDGRRGGSLGFWAWRQGEKVRSPLPSRGSVLQLVSDKASYVPGDRARLLVRNPYPAATAILTTETAGLLDHQTQRVDGAAAVFELPIRPEHAPFVHVTVTLLPIGAKGEDLASHRIAAIRLPVSLRDAMLDVALSSDRPTYQPGEEAEISITVKDHGQPESKAEIALGVVDEGVLRLTAFHQPDPATVLRPGFPLDFRLVDTRRGLAELLERSHVPGDGGGPESSTITSARSKFVETALWRSQLRTDASGVVRVRFKLPDNLTEFRMMALALDDEGKGAAAEGSFLVRKPVLLDPVLPRFATLGDRFEAAAMVHNTGSQPFHGVVKLGERLKPVDVPAGGRVRVGFELTADRVGEMTLSMAVADSSGDRDRVLRKLEIEQPGIEQRPHLAGAFRGEQKVKLALPPDLLAPADGALLIKVGQHLWPELGSRLDYLLDYPHGCVEQTTSSTLPLIAARDILPRIGFTRLGEQALRDRIRAGLERLATMRTDSGGLAYWPGGTEPNVYGTAYAMRAVVLGKQAGVEPPRGLLEGMTRFLTEALLKSSVEPEVRAAIAQSLGELGQLPASTADALYADLAPRCSVFGQASLALALSALPAQGDRVAKLLDGVERAFDAKGDLTSSVKSSDFYYYGSPRRTAAQAAIALSRLRSGSQLVPVLVNDLAAHTDAYTTQSTAYSLLAVAEHLRGTAGDAAAVELKLDGQAIGGARDLGVGSREFRIPLASLRGRSRTLELTSPSEQAVAFLLEASYRLPLGAAGAEAGAARTVEGSSAPHGPDVYRVYSNAAGEPIDLGAVHAGDVVRVALLLRLPSTVSHDRRGYLAVTDRLPAGFEPVEPDLATVGRVPELSEAHPFAGLLRGGGAQVDHVELHDDRVNVYFDHLWDDVVAASYLARATTPGRFVLPPAAAELMYEPDSLSYSEAGEVVVQ